MAQRLNIPSHIVDEWVRLYVKERESLTLISRRGVTIGNVTHYPSPQAIRYHLKKRDVSMRREPTRLARAHGRR